MAYDVEGFVGRFLILILVLRVICFMVRSRTEVGEAKNDNELNWR